MDALRQLGADPRHRRQILEPSLHEIFVRHAGDPAEGSDAAAAGGGS